MKNIKRSIIDLPDILFTAGNLSDRLFLVL
jgi:hypothetical protein